MSGDSSGISYRAAVFAMDGDAGRPKGVTTNLFTDTRRFGVASIMWNALRV